MAKINDAATTPNPFNNSAEPRNRENILAELDHHRAQIERLRAQLDELDGDEARALRKSLVEETLQELLEAGILVRAEDIEDDLDPKIAKHAAEVLGPDVLVERRMCDPTIEWVSIELPSESYEVWVIRTEDRHPEVGAVLVADRGEIHGQAMAAQIDLVKFERDLRAAEAEVLAIAAVGRLRAARTTP